MPGHLSSCSPQAHSSPGTGTLRRPHSLPPAGLRGHCGEHLRTATPAITSRRQQSIIPDGCGDIRCTPPHAHTGHTHTPTRVIVQRGAHLANLGACRSLLSQAPTQGTARTKPALSPIRNQRNLHHQDATQKQEAKPTRQTTPTCIETGTRAREHAASAVSTATRHGEWSRRSPNTHRSSQ